MNDVARNPVRGPAIPSLPDPLLPTITGFPDKAERYQRELELPQFPERWWFLRSGCYLIKLTSSTNATLILDGTLRAEYQNTTRIISGDLYQRLIFRTCSPVFPRKCFLTPAPGPNPADGIPIFTRGSYRFYLRVKEMKWLLAIAPHFTLEFEMHRFESSTRSWTNEGTFAAEMFWTTAPYGYPSSGDYLEGDVKNSAGTVVGRLSMGWVSSYFRRAIVEIDRVSQSEAPLDNCAGINWRSIFDKAGWDVTAIESDTNVAEISGEGWSDNECHQGMLKWRDSADLDTQWRYHLLCVRFLDSTPRGIMYDAYGGDSNNIPREGAAIASNWTIPNEDPWGKCKGMRFGAACAPYFRTAVHEIGHAMMMFHPSVTTGNHIMQVTPQIATNAPPGQFPDNIEWTFSEEDIKMLRHLPDVVVRPGTVLRFGTDVGMLYTGIPVSPMDLTAVVEGLTVQVSPLLETVPIGAPVRLNVSLVNKGSDPVPVPDSLNMKSGIIAGTVVDPSGTVRTFSTIIRYLDLYEMQILPPDRSISDSLTLLRGPDGPLFPSSGIHRIIVTLTWYEDGFPVQVSGETSVMITPPVDEEHAKAANKVLTTPDTLLTLVVGGDHIKDGIDAVQAAVNNSVLRPHFAYIEAKRLAQRFGKRKADLKAASELIADDTIMSRAEIKKTAKIIKAEGADSAPGKTIVKVLKSKVSGLGVADEIKNMVELL